MEVERIRAIQRWYPQIYLACHIRHRRAVSTDAGLSEQDSSLLGHLDEQQPMAAHDLARHLGVRPSTLSATLNRLARLGYVTRTRAAADRRVIELRLSHTGARAMQAASVLEASRVAALLDRLTAEEQRMALNGLALLARAARQISTEQTDGRRSRRPETRRRTHAQGGKT
jgi:DNA-binding MarR family transcriptional regulator